MKTDDTQSRRAALSIGAITWGLVHFGLLLWLPGALADQGHGMGPSSRLLAESSLIAQASSIAGWVPVLGICALIIMWPAVLALALMMQCARKTRNNNLDRRDALDGPSYRAPSV